MSDNDDLYEESAAHALRVAAKARQELQQAGGSAVDISASGGLQAQQLTGDNLPMNEGRRYSGGGRASGDIMERERAENQIMMKNARMMEGAELSMEDLLLAGMNDPTLTADERLKQQQFLRQNARKAAAVANHMVDQGANHMITDAYMNPGSESASIFEEEMHVPPPSNDAWVVTKHQGKLQSGKKIPLFMVEDRISGMTTGKHYRVHAIAEKVANVINITGDPDNARVGMINREYDRHVDLRQKLAKGRKMIAEGRSDNSGKIEQWEHELQQVNAKLGIG